MLRHRSAFRIGERFRKEFLFANQFGEWRVDCTAPNERPDSFFPRQKRRLSNLLLNADRKIQRPKFKETVPVRNSPLHLHYYETCTRNCALPGVCYTLCVPRSPGPVKRLRVSPNIRRNRSKCLGQAFLRNENCSDVLGSRPAVAIQELREFLASETT